MLYAPVCIYENENTTFPLRVRFVLVHVPADASAALSVYAEIYNTDLATDIFLDDRRSVLCTSWNKERKVLIIVLFAAPEL